MTVSHPTWFLIVIFINLAILGLALVIDLLRLLKGPTLPDRMLATDLTAMVVAAFSAIYSVRTGRGAYLDVTVGIVLVSFITTLGFARYLLFKSEKR